MSRVRRSVPANVPPTERATGAAPASKCGRKTRGCVCGPRGRERHHSKEHVDGRCTREGCKCTEFRPAACTQPQLENGACRFHGGKALNGSALPQFKHGGRSKYLQFLNGRMASMYQSAATDPDLLSLTAELALTEARIADTLTRLDSDASASRYGDLAKAFADFEAAGKRGDIASATNARTIIRTLIEGGQRDGGLHAELTDQIDLKRRLAEGQARILRDTHQMIALNRVMEILAQVADIVRRNVPDPKQVTAVVTDLSRLLGTGVDATTTAGRTRTE